MAEMKPNMTVPTKRVRVKETDAEVNINIEDFNPDLHEEVEEETKRKPLQKRGPAAKPPVGKAVIKPTDDDDEEDED